MAKSVETSQFIPPGMLESPENQNNGFARVMEHDRQQFRAFLDQYHVELDAILEGVTPADSLTDKRFYHQLSSLATSEYRPNNLLKKNYSFYIAQLLRHAEQRKGSPLTPRESAAISTYLNGRLSAHVYRLQNPYEYEDVIGEAMLFQPPAIQTSRRRQFVDDYLEWSANQQAQRDIPFVTVANGAGRGAQHFWSYIPYIHFISLDRGLSAQESLQRIARWTATAAQNPALSPQENIFAFPGTEKLGHLFQGDSMREFILGWDERSASHLLAHLAALTIVDRME